MTRLVACSEVREKSGGVVSSHEKRHSHMSKKKDMSDNWQNILLALTRRGKGRCASPDSVVPISLGGWETTSKES